MIIFSESPAAAEWLEQLDSDYELIHSDSEKADLRIFVPVSAGPENALQAIIGGRAEREATDYRSALPAGDSQGAVLIWSPRTLKEILNTVLKLARYTRLLPQAMALIAREEQKIKRLQDRIENVRKMDQARRQSVAALIFDGQWYVAGQWIPDIIDRAGGRALWVESGGESAVLGHFPTNTQSVPDIILVTRSSRSSPDAFENAALELSRQTGPSCPVLLNTTANWLSSGPTIYREIESVASALHPSIGNHSDLFGSWIPGPVFK